MTIYLEEESEIRLPVDCRKVAEQVVEETLDYEEFPYEAQVEILLTDNEAIREMNREQRGIDRPTDVLIFWRISQSVFIRKAAKRFLGIS